MFYDAKLTDRCIPVTKLFFLNQGTPKQGCPIISRCGLAAKSAWGFKAALRKRCPVTVSWLVEVFPEMRSGFPSKPTGRIR